ncbi:MAG: alpha/beta fold hydrolase [Bacteroidia bacterium]
MKLSVILFSIFLLLSSCTKEGSEKVNDFYHVEFAGAQIPVLVKGDISNKKIVLFMNGGPGLTGIDVGITNLAKWEENIENEYAVAYFDQRGTGNTYAPIDTSTITLSQFSEDVYSVVKVIKHHYPNCKVYLMSHSFGGLSAADYLINDEFRSEISGWICISGYLVPNPTKAWAYRRTWLAYIAQVEIDKGNDPEKWERCKDWLANTPIIETDEQKSIWREYVGNQEEGIIKDANVSIETKKILKLLFASNYNIFPTYMSDNWIVVLKTIQRHYINQNYLEKIENIDVPTHFIWGQYDDLVPHQIGEKAHSILQIHGKSTFTLMKDAGHEPFLNDPESFAKNVKGWLAEN